MRVLLVEPYFSGSHRAWAEGYLASSSHDISTITMDGQFWRWRLRGGHLELAKLVESEVRAHGPPDVVLATSMVNVPALLAHTRTALHDVPVVLFMHENQLTYFDASKPADYSYAAINWSSMTSSDLVVFNSEFHRASWFDAAHRWLGASPDFPHDEALARVERRSTVVPVGIDLDRLDGPPDRRSPPLIVWNHRVDRDKDPQSFVDALLALYERGADFRVGIAGERFVKSGRVFEPVETVLGDRLVANGFLDEVRYGELLRSSDIVVSTARQEFFGISITEAMYCGAFPVLPDRVVYPERLPSALHDRCLYRGDRLVDGLEWALQHPEERIAISRRLQRQMARFDWRCVAPTLDAVVTSVAQAT